MPSTVCHIAIGKLVLERLDYMGISLDVEDFMFGNVFLDYVKDKNSAHLYDFPEINTDSGTHFFVPNLAVAEKRYSRISNTSLRLGIITHLKADAFFNERLDEKFTLDPMTKTVKSLYDSSKTWELDEFFSFEGLYHAYSECNPLLMEYYDLSLDWIKENIPREISPTGMSTLDGRSPDNWYDLLERRLKNPPKYTGELFTVEELVNFIEGIAYISVDYIKRYVSRLDDVGKARLSPIINIPGEKGFSMCWNLLRKGIVEILLDNPLIDPDLKEDVYDFVEASCIAFREYEEKYHRENNFPPWDFINFLANLSIDALRDGLEGMTIKVLKQLYAPGYSSELNDIFKEFEDCHKIQDYWPSNEWLYSFYDLLTVLAASNNRKIYSIIVSFSAI